MTLSNIDYVKLINPAVLNCNGRGDNFTKPFLTLEANKCFKYFLIKLPNYGSKKKYCFH